MKKSITIPFFLALLSFGLGSCNVIFDYSESTKPSMTSSNEDSTTSSTDHIHNYSDKYYFDESYHYYKCDGCDEVKGKENHIGGEENCLSKAICEICNQPYGELGTHSIIAIPKIEETCTENGIEKHFKCTTCEKLFIQEGNEYKEVDAEDLIINASHDYGTLIEGTASLCEESGTLSHYRCSVCNKYFTESKIETTLEELTVNANGHNYGSLIEKIEPTCTENGMKAHYHCNLCDSYFTSEKVKTNLSDLILQSTGHNEVIDEAIEATCSNPGLTKGSHCSICGEILVKQEKVIVEHDLDNYGCINCDYVIPYTLEIETSSYGVTTSDLEKDFATFGQEVNLTFTPNENYVVVYYTIVNDQGSKTISAFNHTSATITISSNTKVIVKYDLESNYEMFNYCSGNSAVYYYVDGGYQNSSGSKKYTYDEVIASIKDENSNTINSEIFNVTPITTFANGKWVNPFYTKNNYGLSLYSSETEYSGIKFNSTNYIYSITITFYSNDYPGRALVESEGKTLNEYKESETVYSYMINGYDFSITNISGGNYLYIPSIEIVYSSSSDLIAPIKISFDANGGNGTMEDQIVENINFSLNDNQFTKDGYRFIGWSTTKDGYAIYGDNETFSGEITKNTTLYAVYEIDPSQIAKMAVEYSNQLSGDLSNIYAYYGGSGEHDITKYVKDFIPEYKGILELQFGKIVYVGDNDEIYKLCSDNFISVSQSYENADDISLLDAYYELAYSYYYQGTQIQYDQGSSYQRKIRNMVPEAATELYQKYMDCSTFVSNAFYNAFDEVVVSTSNIQSVTTQTLINFARDNIGTSNEVILYKDSLLSMTAEEKQIALQEFKNALQPGDLYVYRHGTSKESGHVMLYVGNGYFLHSTGSSYNYTSLVDKYEKWTSVQGSVKPEGSVRYQSCASTVYSTSSTRYLFYVDPDGSDSNVRYAILRPLNREGLKLSSTTIARCMASRLDIEKSANKTTSVSLGDYITYSITIKNNSNKTISNVSITDVIPEHTTFVSMSSSYNPNHSKNNIIWNIPYINANDTITLSYQVKVNDEINNIGKVITSTGKVGHISLNTLNISISSLNQAQLNNFVDMALEYYNNPNVYYSATANNSTADPTENVVTFSNGANFVTTLYKRYYESIGQTLDISSELTEVTNAEFMNSIITSSGIQKSSKLYKMMVNGGYGGTYFTKDYYMDRMRTVEYDYLLPGDIISFKNSSAPNNQYLYLGDIVIDDVSYRNAFFIFTSSAGVKLIYGDNSDALLQKFIGYYCFAVIRPSLYQ